MSQRESIATEVERMYGPHDRRLKTALGIANAIRKGNGDVTTNMDELRKLFLTVADICDGGECYDMKRVCLPDGTRYGAALQEAYQAALHSEPGSTWYDEALEENKERLNG